MSRFSLQYLSIVLITILVSCQTKPGKTNTGNADSGTIALGTDCVITIGQHDDEYVSEIDHATFFIVVADTGHDYYSLHRKMFTLNQQLNLPVDTLGRYFNENKNLIALPDNDEDEIYAGDYFPRRFPSENLSLEYLAFYQEKATEKTIALVTGIYESEQSADSALAILKRAEPNGFKIKADVYVGCMH